MTLRLRDFLDISAEEDDGRGGALLLESDDDEIGSDGDYGDLEGFIVDELSDIEEADPNVLDDSAHVGEFADRGMDEADAFAEEASLIVQRLAIREAEIGYDEQEEEKEPDLVHPADEPRGWSGAVLARRDAFFLPRIYRELREFLVICGYTNVPLFSKLPSSLIEEEKTLVLVANGSPVVAVLGPFGNPVQRVRVSKVSDDSVFRPQALVIHSIDDPRVSRKVESDIDESDVFLSGMSVHPWFEAKRPETFLSSVRQILTIQASMDMFHLYLAEHNIELDDDIDINGFHGDRILPYLIGEYDNQPDFNLIDRDIEISIAGSDDVVLFPSQASAGSDTPKSDARLVVNRLAISFCRGTDAVQMHSRDFLRFSPSMPVTTGHSDDNREWAAISAFVALHGGSLPQLDRKMRKRYNDLNESIILRLRCPRRDLLIVFLRLRPNRSNTIMENAAAFDEDTALTAIESYADGSSSGAALVIIRNGVGETFSDMLANKNVHVVRVSELMCLANAESALPTPVNRFKAAALRNVHLGPLAGFGTVNESTSVNMIRRNGRLHQWPLRRANLVAF